MNIPIALTLLKNEIVELSAKIDLLLPKQKKPKEDKKE